MICAQMCKLHCVAQMSKVQWIFEMVPVEMTRALATGNESFLHTDCTQMLSRIRVCAGLHCCIGALCADFDRLVNKIAQFMTTRKFENKIAVTYKEYFHIEKSALLSSIAKTSSSARII